MEIKITSKLVEIPLEKLHIQYVPVLTPMNIWKNDMSLVNSPHVELLRLIESFGFNWERIMESRFVKVRQHRAICGLDQWNEKKIKEHIEQRWKIYCSLLKYGFKKKKSREKPVIVLKQPFWKTRFGLNECWLDMWEIWDGGRRCSAWHVLLHKKILGVFAEDAKPGSGDKGKFEKKLAKCEGVWK